MRLRLKEFLQRWLITTVSVLVAAQVVSGIHYETWHALLVATLVLGFLSAFLKPVLMLLSLPLLIVSFGLFTLVINALLLFGVGQVVKGFYVDTFSAAFWGGLIVSLLSVVLNSLTRTGTARVVVTRGRSRPRPPGGDGPIIDV